MKDRERVLLNVMRLVHAGLCNGNVKSKPIISFGAGDETADMRSLEEIVESALAEYGPISVTPSR